MPTRILTHSATRIICSVLLIACVAATACADVQFDVPATVAARPTDAPQTAAGFYTVEARFDISLLQYRGKSNHVTEALYRIEPIHADWNVADIAPKTRTQTQVVGNVQVEQACGKNQQLGLTLGWHDMVQANANASLGSNDSSTVRYEMLPPNETVAASGTTRRGTGAYFKIRPALDTPLEGVHTFVLQLQVPLQWRISHARVICQAKIKSGQIVQQSFSVPVYLAGDRQAQAAAANLSRRERSLLLIAAREKHEVQRRSRPTIAHELSLTQPRIPENWLTQVMHGSERPLGFERYLPESVREAVIDYRKSKQLLWDLAATPESCLTANL